MNDKMKDNMKDWHLPALGFLGSLGVLIYSGNPLCVIMIVFTGLWFIIGFIDKLR